MNNSLYCFQLYEELFFILDHSSNEHKVAGNEHCIAQRLERLKLADDDGNKSPANSPQVENANELRRSCFK